MRLRLLLLAAVIALALGATSTVGVATSAAQTIDPEQTSAALFVAGDINRLSKVRGGAEELVLEKVLQQMYIDNPAIPSENAAGEIKELKAVLACPQAPTQASLQAMAGNQRILAILAALESAGNCSPPVELSKVAPEAKLAVTHLAGIALASSSDIFANAESPKYFEPLADQRNNLAFTSFAPATVLRGTRALASRDSLFGTARNLIWQATSHESVFASWEGLIAENEYFYGAPVGSAINRLVDALINGKGNIETTPEQLAELFTAGQKVTQEQTCTHGSGQEQIGAETIPGVPRLTCNGGALYEASKATPRPESEWSTRLSELRFIANKRAAIVAEERGLMIAAAEMLRPSEEKAASVEQATAQAQTQITEEENEYAKYEAENKTRNEVKNGLKIVGEVAGSIGSFFGDSPTEGVNGLISAAFEIYQQVEGALVTPPPGPQEIALKDMTNLTNQLSGFQQYTQEAFRALNTQVAQLQSQVAQDTYEIKLEVGSLAEKMSFAQQTIFQLEDEIQTLFSTQAKAELRTTIADSVGWVSRTGEVLSSSKLQESFVALQKYATEIANGALVNNSETQPYTFEGAGVQLTSKRTGEPAELNEAITYLAHFPVEQGWETTALPPTLANTTFWSEGARAYAQLLLENTSRVTAANKAGLKSLENEGVTLEKAQNPWSEHSGGAKTGNTVLDHALEKVEQAAAGTGVEGKRSVGDLLKEAAQRSFESGLKAHTTIAGNPTNVNLWGGANQLLGNLENFEKLKKYPALLDGGTIALGNEELSLINTSILNGVRLGIIGARGSGDEMELRVINTNAEEITPEVELYRKGVKIFEGNSRTEDVSADVNQGIVVLQREAYEAGLEELKKEATPANRLAGARALVQSYVKLGLPQALSSDPVLETEIAGTGAQFLDPEPGTPRPVSEELNARVRSWVAQTEEYEKHGASEANVQKELIGEIGERSSAWAGEVAKTVKPYIEGAAPEFSESGGEAVSEQSPMVESTINRLRLTRDLLTESRAPGAETIAPTNIGTTEATLNGEVSPNGGEVESCEFEYGASEPHGHSVECATVPKATESGAVVSAKVTNWTPAGGSFHERLVVKTWGGTTYGEDVKVQLAQSVNSKEGPVVASTTTPGATIELKIQEPPPAYPGLPAGASAPVGLLSLNVEHVAFASSVPVRINVPAADAATALYMVIPPKAGSTFAGEYVEVPRSQYTITGSTINVTLIDGGSDDLDGQANGRVFSELVPVTGVAAPVGPSVTTTGAAVGVRVATLEGTVNPNGKLVTSCKFKVEELSASLPTGRSETVPCAVGPGSGSEPVAVTGLATELSPGTEYRFSLAATNASGSATSEPPGLFTTSTLPGPSVVTGAATNIKSRAALLHGTVNPNGTAVAKCWFTVQEEAGKKESRSFGCIEGVGAGHAPVPVLVNANNLRPLTRYIFRLHAENIEGTQGVGLAKKFKTL